MEHVRMIRAFLFFEALSFLIASQIHFGTLMKGYEHAKAGTAESVIASVLILGLIATVLRPASARAAGLAAQAFALLGTCVGLFTIAIGVGPRTAPDLAYHFILVPVLIWGLLAMRRAGRRAH
ncbi:MAG TPA: hypothetical protein VJ385_18885 [Fibrobacteria bacterium]|nr:hypothetical protein [Fibrobacteria bacterium]